MHNYYPFQLLNCIFIYFIFINFYIILALFATLLWLIEYAIIGTFLFFFFLRNNMTYFSRSDLMMNHGLHVITSFYIGSSNHILCMNTTTPLERNSVLHSSYDHRHYASQTRKPLLTGVAWFRFKY